MENIYTNCTIVTREQSIKGTLVVDDGLIVDLDESEFHGNGAVDLGGDFLLPGLIEMHTDNLEKNIQPRPGVIWPSVISAAIAHDAQIAGAGITTVFDAIAVGGLRESSLRTQIFEESILALCRGNVDGYFKADHFLHLRCEISDEKMEKMLVSHCDNPHVRLLSMMDHTPGQRQWADLVKWRTYHRDKKWSEAEVEEILIQRKKMQELYAEKHHSLVVSIARERAIPLASHDDTSINDVAVAAAEGVDIAEFPTSIEAAVCANENGMKTIMGAPNAIRGESHSGNISASALAKKNILDGMSSDYVPSSLLHAAFHFASNLQIPLHRTVAMVSYNIAEMVGLEDRGELVPGKKADMLQVSMADQLPILRKVWKRGMQIA